MVDDGSPDGTADLAEQLGAELGGIDVLRRTAKSGLGSAYRAGFAWGLERGWDVFVEMDADLSHDPGALPDLVAPHRRRRRPGGRVAVRPRRLDSQLAVAPSACCRGAATSTPRPSSVSGSRTRPRDSGPTAPTSCGAIDLGVVRAEGYGFQIEMVRQVLDHGGRVIEVPIRFVDRIEGESKMSMHIVVEALALVTWWAALRACARWPRRPGPTLAAQHLLRPGPESIVPRGGRAWALDPASAII